MSEDSAPAILVAGGDGDARASIARMLSPRYSVTAFADGIEALDFARQHRPDVILAGADAASMLRAVRADEGLREIPFIQLFSRDRGEPKSDADDVMPDDWLGTPFTAAELTRRIDSHRQLGALKRALAQNEREAEAFRGRIAVVLGHLPFGVTLLNPKGEIVYANPARDRLLRTSNLPRVGEAVLAQWPAFHPDGRPLDPVDYPVNRALNGEYTTDLEIEYRRDVGPPCWLRVSGIPIFGPDGKVLSVMAVAVEITGEKQAQLDLLKLTETLEQRAQEETDQRLKAEDDLRQAQKMQALGQLTGGVAHDFNNLLQIVLGNLDRLQHQLATPDEPLDRERAGRYLTGALGGTERATHLTRQLLAFARRQPLDPSLVDVNKLVLGMTELFRRSLGGAIAIATETTDGLWAAYVDANQLESALLNLAVNARDAMTAGGRLTIRTANIHLDAAQSAYFVKIDPGDYVAITVRDTGAGIDPRILSQVFEPFFTTKTEGKGTGLGLSQVYGFVTQSGGQVTIASEIGRGTDVTLFLPAREAPK